MDQLLFQVMKKPKGWNTLPFLLKYYNALEWESSFTLALNAADAKKFFRQKSFIIEFPTKKNSGCISLSTLEVELEMFKDLSFLKYHNAQEWECIFTVGLKTAEDIE